MQQHIGSPSTGGRIEGLDGLRGWAALMVVAFHGFWEIFGGPFPVLRNLWISALLNGPLAVNVFFVLSGFVLTRPGWRTTDKTPVVRQILKRYVRLTPPVLATALLVWAAMLLGLTRNVAAGKIIGRDDWMTPWLQFPANFSDALGFGLWAVYSDSKPQPNFDPFLWVMPYEFWAALVVLGVCWMERRLPYLYGVIGAMWLVSIIYMPEVSCFVMGAGLALLHRDGWLDPWSDRRWINLTCVAVLMIGAVAVVGLHVPRQTTCFAAIIVLIALRAPLLRRALASPVSQFLGRISFPLYLMQFVVIMVPIAWAIIWADAAGQLGFPMALAIGTATVVLSLVAALAFMPIERGTLALSRAVGQLVQPIEAMRGAESANTRPIRTRAARKQKAGAMAGRSGAETGSSGA
jgi:peptidoglycan/LPS O-acetylase OafA/YrhL